MRLPRQQYPPDEKGPGQPASREILPPRLLRGIATGSRDIQAQGFAFVQSALKPVKILNVDRAPRSKQHDQNGEANCSLSSGYRENKENEYLPR